MVELRIEIDKDTHDKIKQNLKTDVTFPFSLVGVIKNFIDEVENMDKVEYSIKYKDSLGEYYKHIANRNSPKVLDPSFSIKN